MPRQQISLKQLAVNKDNTAIAIAVGVASFVVIFSLVASKALLDQRAYQSRVISKKQVALKQTKDSATAVESLKNSYTAFSDQQQNIIGGSSAGQGDKDGPNGRIVLDALPSKYDFPALTTSLTKLFNGYKVTSLSGSDDEVAQSAATASGTPTLTEIPFNMVVEGPSAQSKDILELYERSIRPIQVKSLTITGDANNLKYTVDANTYFQPQKTFDVKTEIVR